MTDRFGKYQIIRRLGGGMSDVYLASDSLTGRQLVLKLISSSAEEAKSIAIEAERRGAGIQKQLARYDRILDVYDTGEQDGYFFVAMEYFPGRTLAQILNVEGRLNARRAARYTAEICSQLRLLHGFVSEEETGKGAVVHGDIKPSNIQIGTDDQLRILDFGIAKFIASGRDLTRLRLGSPGYCSPERLRDSQVDIQADVWATGVCLYEMIAGMPPFQAHNTRELEELIQSRQPPTALPGDCPVALSEIVAKALAGAPHRRYQTAEALESDLLAFLENRLTQAAQEKLAGKKANATVLRDSRPAVVKGSQAVSERHVRLRIGKVPCDLPNTAIALLAGILCGLALFLPMTRYLELQHIRSTMAQRKDYVLLPASVLTEDWQSYQTLRHRGRWLNSLFSSEDLADGFRANLLDSANNLIGRYRRASEDQLSQFDWSRARLCLLYALEIDSANARAHGQLYLCDGYLSLQERRQPSVKVTFSDFQRASALMPHSPDPHLGLARAYIYRAGNIGMALAEFQRATQLGYALGPRETEQEADGFLLRAEAELKLAKRTPPGAEQDAAKLLRLAARDMDRAQSLYEPIAGFGHAEASLAQIDRKQSEQAALEQALFTTAKPRPRFLLFKARFIRQTASYRWR